jgi:glyoxylase-like metal-dependent hydrolase (beta-lactamase superfamily II)
MIRSLLCICLLLAAALAYADEQPPVRIADGVYAFVGLPGDIAPDNRGRIGNSGFIVGDTGIIVVDTGVSHRHGTALRAAIRKVSDLPVVLVILTHAVQEFLYGTTAFDAASARLLCHEKSAALMRERCEHCLENLRLILGDDEMVGTRLVVPTETVSGTTDITVAGRRLSLVHPGWASTPGDLMVLDRATGVMFTGGVVVNGRIPELRDGRFDDWIAALDALDAIGATILVPGYGPPLPSAEGRVTRDYLRALDRRVRELFDGGASLMEAVDQGAVPAFADWSGYETVHRKNVLGRYLQLELEDLAR